ncbi:hypothetical protein Q667_15745 [Marinobacter sp. C1S70]|uniref:O-antigen ligase family protein n=1 Tax=Marinobacter sp. C1S70 TaxID=1396859 RepID=UPI0003B87843|nr:O-antigen ligase family protein [Marinobacter sp. C1S70]ERS87024.1 hypothetical protein Q667_15745 [Marinobacter sp. C1S70]
MKLVVSYKELVLFFCLPFMFFSDILYGLFVYYGIGLPLTPGVLFRGGLFFICLTYVILYFKYLNVGIAIWLLVLFLFSLPGLFSGLVYGDNPKYDFFIFTKLFYFPLVAAAFFIFFKLVNVFSDDVLKHIEYSGYFLGVSLVLSQTFGLSRDTYGDYAYGNVGVFYAQNDLSLALGLSLLIAAYRLLFLKFSVLRCFLLLLSFIACINIGTNSALFIPVVVFCVMFSAFIMGGSSGFTKLTPSKVFLFFGFSVFAIALFFQVLEIFLSHDYQAKKIEALLEGEFSRAQLVSAAWAYLSQRGLLLNIFGEGFDSFHRGVSYYFGGTSVRRFVESDPFDIMGGHGIAFLLALYFYPIYHMAINIWRSFLNMNAGTHVLIASSIFLFVMYSVFVGHTLISPIPSTLMAGILALSHMKELNVKKLANEV